MGFRHCQGHSTGIKSNDWNISKSNIKWTSPEKKRLCKTKPQKLHRLFLVLHRGLCPRLSDRCEIFPPNTNIFSDFSCRMYTWDREQTTVTADSFFSHLFLQLPFNSLTNRLAPCEERLCRPHKMICKKDTHYYLYCRCFPTQYDGQILNFIAILPFKRIPPWRWNFLEDLLKIAYTQ